MLKRNLIFGAVLALAIAGTSTASAGERECTAAHNQAATELKAGALSRARKQLLACSSDECTAVKSECGVWLSQVDAQVASIVVRGTSGGKLTIDGASPEPNVDGTIPLDPGTHTLTLDRSGGSVSRAVSLVPGERRTLVNFDDSGAGGPVSAEATTETPSSSGGSSKVLPLAIGGLGVVAAAVGAVFWIASSGKVSDLDDEKCAPNCAADDVDSVRTQRLLGDIFFIAGIAAIGVATYLFLAPSKPAPAAVTARGAKPKLRFTGSGFTF